MFWTITVGACLALLALKVLSIGKRSSSLPPGPPTVPLLGNLNSLPTEFIHYKFTEWARQYGDIYSLMIGPGVTVVLSSATAVRELMDKRGGTTSDRPPSHIGHVVTQECNVSVTRYSDKWRKLRRAIHEMLIAKRCVGYLPVQQAESLQLMHDMLITPDKSFWHFRRFSNSVILSIVFGKRSPRYETRESTAFFHANELWELLNTPGAQPPVDLIPILKYVPERWAPWKLLCRETRRRQRELYFGLMTECEERVRDGRSRENVLMDALLLRREGLNIDREEAGYIGGALMEGGGDTTSMFFQTLLLCLCAFPEAQKAAQLEMEAVIEQDRMPTLEDAANLPYLSALIKEVHRFRPVAPLAMPHAAIADEVYNGYLVPKGASILINIWGIYHDPETFDEPDAFRPERYLKTEFGTKTEEDGAAFRHTLIYGAGRRICPGYHLANNSILINTMNIIWGFNVSPAVDTVTKKPIVPDLWAFEMGLLTGPKPFTASIVPRSAQHARIIEQEFASAIAQFEPFEERLSAEDKAWLKENRAL